MTQKPYDTRKILHESDMRFVQEMYNTSRFCVSRLIKQTLRVAAMA